MNDHPANISTRGMSIVHELSLDDDDDQPIVMSRIEVLEVDADERLSLLAAVTNEQIGEFVTELGKVVLQQREQARMLLDLRKKQ